jgi:hypothetical protein
VDVNADRPVDEIDRQFVARLRNPAATREDRPTIPYTELPESKSDSPIAAEWNF